MSWEMFQGLPGTMLVADLLEVADSKCAVIAHFRMSRLFDAVMADLQAKYPEKK
jgi:hypothetical protein